MPAISTPDLTDAHPEARAIELQFASFGAIARFHGPAVTIKCHEDNSLVKQCVAEPGAGRVIVVDGGGSLRRALLGDMLAEQAAANGWAGLVINGAVRDASTLRTLDIGIKALGTNPRKSTKTGAGDRDVVLHIGGVDFIPGEIAYSDDDGIVVVPAS